MGPESRFVSRPARLGSATWENVPTIRKSGNVTRELAMLKRGLVLITGAAGSGKSTTLASMLDFRNASSNAGKGTFAYFAEPLQPVI